MKKALLALGALAATGVMALALSACGGSSNGSGEAVASPGASEGSTLPVKEFKLAMKPDSKKGADGDVHDAFVPSTELSVKAGQTVRVTIVNYDDAPHSFTSPALEAGAQIPPSEQQHEAGSDAQNLKVMPKAGVGVNEIVPGETGGKPGTTTFTFTAPEKAGEYIWYCAFPCDAYAMAQIGFMRGYVTVA